MNTDTWNNKHLISLLLLECICTISNYLGISKAGRWTTTSKHSSRFYCWRKYFPQIPPIRASWNLFSLHAKLGHSLKSGLLDKAYAVFFNAFAKEVFPKGHLMLRAISRDWQRRVSDHTAHYNPAIERDRAYKINQWAFNYANHYRRPIQGLTCLFHLRQSHEKLMTWSSVGAIKQAPTLLEGKNETFRPKESTLLRIFLFNCF